MKCSEVSEHMSQELVSNLGVVGGEVPAGQESEVHAIYQFPCVLKSSHHIQDVSTVTRA